MKKRNYIIESVNFISEEDLLVQELDKRLSFDVLMAAVEKGADLCDCLVKKFEPDPTPTACGLRG